MQQEPIPELTVEQKYEKESESEESIISDSDYISPELWSIILDLGIEEKILSQIGEKSSHQKEEEISRQFSLNP